MEIERLRLQYEITNAQLLYEITPAKMNISVKHGEVDIKREPLKLTIDNRGFFDSVGIKSSTTQAREQAQKGKAAAQDAAGRYTREKNAMLGPDTMSPAEIAAARNTQPVQTELTFTPSEKPKMSWSGGKVTVNAERDRVDIEWEPQSVDFTYVPYSVEFYVDKW
jgi:hypothetical protein